MSKTTYKIVTPSCDLKRLTRKFAKQLLEDGTAISKRQAEQIAQISLDPHLSDTAKHGLLYLAHSKGADFEISELTDADIEEAAQHAAQIEQRIALSIVEPMGSA